MFYLELCEHQQRLIGRILLGVIEGHAILVVEMLQMSVSGTFFSGPTSFLCKVTFQPAAGEILKKAVCLGAGPLRQKQKCAEGLLLPRLFLFLYCNPMPRYPALPRSKCP